VFLSNPKQRIFRARSFIWPVPGIISSLFRLRRFLLQEYETFGRYRSFYIYKDLRVSSQIKFAIEARFDYIKIVLIRQCDNAITKSSRDVLKIIFSRIVISFLASSAYDM
jgi:hypothetical protein